MARAGIYKSEVLKARNVLLAQGRYPSVDAIRQELGNTGSKATIHRYLKEIEEEDGQKVGAKVRLSEPLQDLVARLADRLQLEAEVRIEELTARHAEELARHRQADQEHEITAAALRASHADLQTELGRVRTDLTRTTERLQQEILDHALATQQLRDLGDRLQAEAEHRQSLEEKHAHAREALEHFRAASKEQREQEQRQHEQQIQYLQGEIKTLRGSLVEAQHDSAASKQGSARLASDLARSEQALSEAREALQSLKSVRADLLAAEQQVERLGQQVVQLQAAQASLRSLNAELEAERTVDRAEIQQLRTELAATKAAAEAQEQLVEKIQGWIARQPADPERTGSPTER